MKDNVKQSKARPTDSSFEQARDAMIHDAQRLSEMFARVSAEGTMPMDEGAFRLLKSYTFKEVSGEVAIMIAAGQVESNAVDLLNAIILMDF